MDAPIPTGFEWDFHKAAQNEAKHGVTFEDAATVFGDSEALVRDDADHSWEEVRFQIVGYAWSGAILSVTCTMRGERTRIISARRANASERYAYERSASR